MAAPGTAQASSWRGTIHADTIHTAIAQAGMAFMTRTKVDTILNALDAAGLLRIGAAEILHGQPAAGGGPRPTVTVLCGSSRFYAAFQQANYDLTMAGHIVLSIGFYPHAKAEHGHGEGVGHDSAEKVALDELHMRKIDLADQVLVLNVGGYIGQSTRSEIAYAERIGRPISYLEQVGA